jgi:ElaB/YqjD/DUF883 family membrane-anchored ribosome-binding protein
MATQNPESVFQAAASKASQMADTETAQQLQDFAKDGLKKATDFAKQNPVLTVAATFGLGVLIGAWLRRD